MDALRVTGSSESGDHLTLTAPDGTEYRLPIDDALRAALRQARAAGRPEAEAVQLRPRDIQALLRAGRTVDEIVEEHDLARERVAPFEPPVLAERTFIAGQARDQRVGREPDSPTLGDLVVDRLAARGVEVDDLTWDAHRAPGEPWLVGVRFSAAGRERTALWSVNLQSRTLTAADDEARWLSETDVSSRGRRRGAIDGPLGASRSRGSEPPWARGQAASEAGEPADAPDPGDSPEASTDPGALPNGSSSTADSPEVDMTEALLDDLAANRGTRQEIDDLQDELDLDSLADDPPAAHPPASRPDQARDAQVLSLDAHRRNRPSEAPADGPDPDEVALDPRGSHPSGRGRGVAADVEVNGDSTEDDAPTTPVDSPVDDSPAPDDDRAGDDAGTDDAPSESAAEETPAPRKAKPAPKKDKRRSVPSWDEIVFGSRSDTE
jgi:hypothetical protein